ncbi:MAG: LacI family DNA-binding transcriptional regulator [Pseudomonadota bacterium]
MSETEDPEAPATPPKRPRRVTAQDVATAADVSRSAVSRAFTPGAYLDAAKRELVLRTALQLGYRPNALAASLQGARTNLVGIIAGDIGNQYDSELVAHLVARLNEADKWPLVLGGAEAVTEQSVMSVLSYPLDALIVRGGSIDTALFSNCAKLNIPVIFSGRVVEGPFIDSVCCRNAEGTARAVDLLLARGRRRFGFIGGPAAWSSVQERLAGVERQLARAGLPLIVRCEADYRFAGGSNATRGMLAQHPLDAIICANDAMALGALSVARNEAGRSVPEDLSIIGFDDVTLAAWPDFNLTTLRNPQARTVTELLRLLDARLTDPEKPSETVLIDPILMERGTH